MDSTGEWTSCKAGELRGLASVLKRRRRRRDWQRSMLAGLALVVCAIGLFWAVPSQQAAGARISCREVHTLAVEFVGGRLDAEKSTQIRRHLDHCRPCQQFVEQQRRGDAAALEPPVPCPKGAPGFPIAQISRPVGP